MTNVIKLIALTAIMSLGAAYADPSEYFWTGAAQDNSVNTVGNWALADGTVAVSMPNDSTSALVFTNDTALTLTQTGKSYFGGYAFRGADVTFSTSLAFVFPAGCEIVAAGGGEYAFLATGDIKDAGTVTFDVASGSTVRFGTRGASAGATVTLASDATLVKKGGGALTFNRVFTWNGTLQLEEGQVTSVYASSTAFGSTMALRAVGRAPKTLFLDGAIGGKTIYNYSEEADARGTLTLKNNNDGKTLVLGGPDDTQLSALFDIEGSTAAKTWTVAWSPASDKELKVVGQAFDYDPTKGKLYLQANAGTLRIADGAGLGKAFESLTVADGARVTFAADARRTVTTPILLSGATSVLEVEGTDTLLRLTSLSVNGSAIADGVYAGGSAVWLEGDGIVVVGTLPAEPTTTTAKWTGKGADNLLNNPKNWEDETLPNLTDGSLVATFPADTVVTVPSAMPAYRLKGLIGDGALTLGGAAPLVLGSGGLVAAGAVTNKTIIYLSAVQTWQLGAESEISAAGHVLGANSATWSIAGARLNIRSSNSNLPDTVNCTTHIGLYTDNALGGSNTTAYMKEKRLFHFVGTHTHDGGFSCDSAQSSQDQNSFFALEQGTTTFRGKVEGTALNQMYWSFSDGASAVFAGGYRYTGNNASATFAPLYAGVFTVTGTPMNVTRAYVGYGVDDPQTLNLNVASNKTTRGLHLVAGATLNTTVANALYVQEDVPGGVTLNAGTTWNLSADQGVNLLNGVGTTATITSANGSALTLSDNAFNTVKSGETPNAYKSGIVSLTGTRVLTNNVVFAGNVSFTKTGVLEHNLRGVSTSTGTLTVTGGRLAFLDDGSWNNVSNVVVAGSGTLVVPDRNRLGVKTAEISIDTTNGASIEIPSGQSVSCRNLIVDGQKLPQGTRYVGPGVTGGGAIVVGTGGVVLIFR